MQTIQADPLRNFATTVLERVGIPSDQAADAADVLVWANLHGVDTHGVRNLKKLYVDFIAEGRIKAASEIRVEFETPISARLDGDDGLGLAAGCWAMRYAIDKARQSGMCLVAMRHSQHFGAAGYYPMLAIPHDMIGLSMTGFFSTNPLSFSFPTEQEPPFLLDMATSVVPFNRIEMRQELGQSIPLGWGLDAQGQPTTDPAAVRALLPLGGSREQSSHKGYALALLVEVLCAVLSGGWSQVSDTETGLGGQYKQQNDAHFFGAIRVDYFRPTAEFKRDMDAMIRAIHAAPPAPGHDRIYVPGEIEHETKQKRLREGIPLPPNVVASLQALSSKYDVPLEL
jgi:L-2-hydroxycarboxylate dehydrogenase (NAD+)